MAHQEREWTVNEPDEPNIVAVYVIIVLSLVGLAVTMWGLAEYKTHIDSKRQNRVESIMNNSASEKIKANDEAGLKAIEEIMKKKATEK